MKQQKFIYKVIFKYSEDASMLEKTLNELNTDKELFHIIEMDVAFVIIWQD